jgi:hypothetical protein
MDTMIESVCLYRVREGRDDEFIRLVRHDLHSLLGKSLYYIRTDIVRGIDGPGAYKVTDHWRTRGGFNEILREHTDECIAMKARLLELCESEKYLGLFGDVNED